MALTDSRYRYMLYKVFKSLDHLTGIYQKFNVISNWRVWIPFKGKALSALSQTVHDELNFCREDYVSHVMRKTGFLPLQKQRRRSASQ